MSVAANFLVKAKLIPPPPKTISAVDCNKKLVHLELDNSLSKFSSFKGSALVDILWNSPNQGSGSLVVGFSPDWTKPRYFKILKTVPHFNV